MVHFAPFLIFFFFFFLNFDLNQPVWRRYSLNRCVSAVSADTNRFGPSQHESERIRKKKKKKNWTRHQHAGNGVARALSRRATSDASAVPILSHPCIIDDGATMGMLELCGCVFLVKFVSNKEAKEFK